MEMGHFDMKISILLNRLIFGMHIGAGQEIKFNNGTSINIGQMKLKNLILLVVMLVLNKIV